MVWKGVLSVCLVDELLKIEEVTEMGQKVCLVGFCGREKLTHQRLHSYW